MNKSFLLHLLPAGLLAGLLIGPPAASATLVRGPMLQGATTTNLYVLVECTISATNPLTILYGPTTNYGNTATTLFATVSSASPTTHVHRIKLTGLQPNTLYHYQLTGQGIAAADRTFRTLVNPGTPFRFAWSADFRDSSEAGVHGQISGRILNAHNSPTSPLFDLTGGDYSVTNSYAQWTNQWLVPSELVLEAAMPVYLNPGNHDLWRSGSCMRAFDQPPDGTGTNGYFSFDCGDVHVTAVNNYTNYISGTPQWNWAAQDVSNSLQAWKIAMFHEPAYTYASGGHGSNTNMQNMTSNVFEPGGVKVVFAGHNHMYQHNLVNGIRHLTVGAAGAPLYAVSSNASYTVKTVSDNCYLIADASPTNLHMVVYNNVGMVLDTIDLIKPPAPTNLTAVAGTNRVTLHWRAVTGATNYTVRYGTASGGPYTSRTDLAATNTAVTGLVAGTPYYFVVTASDTNGPSARSTQATATPSSEIFYTLAYTAGPHGTLTGSTNQTVASGSDGTAVTAVPDTGYHFADWSDTRTNNPRTDVNVASNISVTANFTSNPSNQAINFPPIGNQVATNMVVLSATADSGLPVGFAVTSGPGQINGGTNLSFTGAGTVAIVATQAGNTNWYPAPPVTNSFQVSKANPTVTAWPSAGGITYGQALSSSVLSGGAATPAGTFAFASPGNTPGAGTHGQPVAFTPSATNFYNGASGTAMVAVAKAPLTIAADAQRKALGEENPPLTLQYSGFVLGENSSALSTEPVAGTTVNVASAVGLYPDAIVPANGAADNYEFDYVTADFTVTEAIGSGTVGTSDVAVAFGPLANGSNYVLEYRASLMTGDWIFVTNREGSNEVSATMTHAGGAGDFGYYRVEGVVGPTAHTWGYGRRTKPGNSKLTMMGIPFITSNQTLNSLMDPLQFNGHYNNAGLADQLMLWNTGTTSYVNLALYDLRSFGAEYSYLTGWKPVNSFGPAAPYTNPVLPAGSAVWIRGSTTNDRKVVISGLVATDGAATNNIVQGLQMIANPFSETITLSNLALRVYATGHYNNAGLADQVMVWDTDTQTYVNLALYDLRSFGGEYAYLTGWKLVNGFGPAAPYVSPDLMPGQGFWFRAVNSPFQWVELNKYLDGLE